MITIQREKNEQAYNDVNLIGFQKDYDKWVVQGIAQNYKKTLQKQRDNYKKGVVQGKGCSARIGKKVVQGLVNDEPFLAPTKDTITKESITKERKNLSSRTPLEDFLTALKENPAYKGIDIDREIHKMNAWFLTPKGKDRKLTHKFILNWLNKCEKDLNQGTLDPKDDPRFKNLKWGVK